MLMSINANTDGSHCNQARTESLFNFHRCHVCLARRLSPDVSTENQQADGAHVRARSALEVDDGSDLPCKRGITAWYAIVPPAFRGAIAFTAVFSQVR